MKPEAIRAAREAAGLSLREFAALCEVSEAAALNWEQGGYRPNPENTKRIRKALRHCGPRITPEEIRTIRGTMSRKTFSSLIGVTDRAVAFWERGINTPGYRYVRRMRRIRDLHGEPLWDAVELQRRVMALEAQVFNQGISHGLRTGDDGQAIRGRVSERARRALQGLQDRQ